MSIFFVHLVVILLTPSRYLIIAYNTSIQVYSAADSLLVRRIPISTRESSTLKGGNPATIVAMRLSRLSPNLIWAACSNGRVVNVDWTKTAQSLQSFKTTSGTAKAMTVVPFGGLKKPHEVVLVAESKKSSHIDIVAYFGPKGQTPQSKQLLSLTKTGNGLHLLESSADGRVLIGSINDRLFAGVLHTESADSFDNFQPQFFSFDTPDIITSLDLKTNTKKPGNSPASKKSKAEVGPTVDILVGGARGGIYLYQDAVSRLQSLSKLKSENETVQAQKFHWHRKAVHSVKWSRDGMSHPILLGPMSTS